MKPAKIFLSHSSNDNEFVHRIANDLKLKNVPVWVDEWEIKVGDSIIERISSGINESGWLAIVLSKNSVKSPWVQLELNTALSKELQQKQVFVLPLLIEDCEIPIFLRDKLYADFRDNYHNGLNTLLQRLIPEVTEVIKTSERSVIHRQELSPNPEEQLVTIIEAKIIGKNNQYSALYDVEFILNRNVDSDWKELFEHPTSFTLSVHKAHVNKNKISWMATESDIKNNKHWIYDWVEDANKRFLPIITQRIRLREEAVRVSQKESNKTAELQNILRNGREGVLIITTNEIIPGLCSLKLEGCTAQNEPGPITQVNFEVSGYIHLCLNCLQKQIDSGKYRVDI
ncbi:MAG: hypothetical protein A2014_06460 [Spirochaetes bacterium GWF1_49_6]|nr:MAG: hypothetical protein A2014_06460 [Spirochaetes bacterium GWF1_49_6]